MSVITFLEKANQSAVAPVYTYTLGQAISELSSFRIGGVADVIVYPRDAVALRELVLFLYTQGIRYMVVGRLSNLLFDDAGFRGVLILTSHICSVKIQSGMILTDVGAPLIRLCLFALLHSIGGFEDLYGIPASVGGAVYMNAGAFETSASTLIESVTAFDPQKNKEMMLCREQLAFGERKSIFQSQKNLCILSAAWRIQNVPTEKIRAKMEARMEHRRKTQPLDLPSAGSVFRRPQGHFAGALIEGAGLKGLRVGGAMVSPKHAGFIVNCDHASARDVLDLIEILEKEVLLRFGVQLSPEIEYIPEA